MENNIPTSEKKTSEDWEKNIIEKLLNDMHKEQRKERRWVITTRLVRSVGFVLMMGVGLVFSLQPDKLPWDNKKTKEPHLALIDLKGPIADDSITSADKLVPPMQAAFDNDQAKALIIHINTPGGSPVQSGRIHDAILTLQKTNKKPIYAIIDDMGASGGYYVAMAADKVYADRASLVGSIGVISSNFGFTELMKNIGVERRVYSSGEHKNFLDPFAPVSQETKDFWEQLLAQTHEQFMSRVKAQRKGKIKDDAEIFSGLIWNGEQALDIGLIDELGSKESVSQLFDSLEYVNYTPRKNLFENFSKGFGVLFQELITRISYS